MSGTNNESATGGQSGGRGGPHMGLSALPQALPQAGGSRRGPTSPTGTTTGILRLNINKPRRSSGSSVEFRTPLDGCMQVRSIAPHPDPQLAAETELISASSNHALEKIH